MREYEDIEEIVTNTKLLSVTCNKCGTSNKVNQDFNDTHIQGHAVSFGYGSRYDGESWSFDLCEDCLTGLVKTFKHVPNGFGESGYFAVYPQVMFDKWKETGDVNLEAGMTTEEIEARGGSIYISDEEYEELYGDED